MLQTIRTWRGLRVIGMGEWPWQKPWDILSNWKWTYNRYGGRELLSQISDRVWDSLRWHLHTRHKRLIKIELRLTFLDAGIHMLECLARDAEERGEEKNQC